MYDPKKIIDISNTLIKGYTSDSNKFLDERRTEWVKKVDEEFRANPVGNDKLDEKAKVRLGVLKEIVKENEKYCRRDINFPDLEAEDQLARITKYKKLREESGITEAFPGVLAEEANIYMLQSKYSEAFKLLAEAIAINEGYPEIIVKRDNVRYMGEQVRCLYMLGKHDDAILKATNARRAASEIDPCLEQEEYIKFSAAPNLQFVPIPVQAYFSACDAIIHHKNWEEDENLQRKFTGLWNDSVTKYKTPNVWRTPMKIAVVSDKIWALRTEAYVKEIAESLYIETSHNSAQKALRLIRTKWGGFNIDYPKSAAAAIALIAFLAIANENQEFTQHQLKEITVAYVVSQSEENISASTFGESFDHYLPIERKSTTLTILKKKIENGEFNLKEETEHMQLVYSGSEGSVLRV